MELEFFVSPGDDDKWHKTWVDNRVQWWVKQGIPKAKLQLLDVTGDDLPTILKLRLISCINSHMVLKN